MPDCRLVITVGTSVFSSASWKAQGNLVIHAPRYRDWLEQEYLESPSLRRTRGWKTVQRIEEELLRDPHAFDDLVDWDPHAPRRYAGELSTLIRLFQRKPEGVETVEEFLRRRYGVIDLVSPSNQKDPARVAAEHLCHVLGNVLHHPACNVAAVLRSDHLRDKVDHFACYLGRLPAGPVDLLVTGGYKAFALLSGLMAVGHPIGDPGGEWRLLYLHEEQQGELVIADLDAQGRWRQSFETGETKTVLRPPVAGDG